MTRERPKIDRELVTSASQIKTWQDCKRKWWFRNRGLKEPEQDFKTQGNVLHGVMERWMLGGATEDVDLYPEGWDEGVDPVFARLIQKLVAKAIDEGVVIKEPNTRVESQVVLDIVPDVALLGYVDVAHWKGIDDHKTTSNMKYALTPEELANDAQMLIYAYWWLLEEEKAGRSPLQVRLKHIVYLKDEKKPRVKPEHTLVSAEDVVKYWNETVVPIAEQMLAMKREFPEHSMWKAVPATDDPKVCKKYRGCPYARICGGVESTDAYLARQERLLKGYGPTTQEGPKVDLTKKLLAKRAANAGAVSVPTPAPVEAPAKAEAQAAAVAKAEVASAPSPVAADRAPWANAGCVACSGTGWNKEGRPCKACDAYNGAKGLPKSDTFNGVTLPESAVADVKVTEAKPITENPVVVEAKPKRTRKPKAEAVDAEVVNAVVPLPEPEVVEVADEPSTSYTTGADPVEKTAPSDTSRQTVDLLLLINAISAFPLKSEDLNVVYNRLTADIAKAAGVNDFLEMDSWKRKDILAIHAKEWARTAVGSYFAIGGGQDFKVLLDTVRACGRARIIQGVL